MSKVVDITNKLDFEEKPVIVIRDKKVEVDNSAETMLKLMGLFDDKTEAEAVPEAYKLMFSEADRKTIGSFKMSFKDFTTLIYTAMDLIRGGDDDTPSEQ